MRRLAAALAGAVLLGGGSFAAAGCGAEDAAGVDVAQAAQATAEKGTARVTMRMTASGLGLPASIAIDATGVTDLDEPRGRLTMDFGPLLALAGAQGIDGKVPMRIDGGRLHVKPPAIPGLRIPGNRSWVTIDLAAVAEAAGLDADGLGALFAMEPSAQLRALEAAKGMKEVGEEQVDGVTTTRLRGSYTLDDFVAALPAGKRERARAALDDLERLAGGKAGFDDPIPAEIWVDEDGITRRLRSTQAIPAQAGQPAGRMALDFRLSDFGAKLDAGAPPAADTYDATKAVSRALGSLAAAGGGAALRNG